MYNPWLGVRWFYDVGAAQGTDVSLSIMNPSSSALRFPQCLCSPCMAGSPLSAISTLKQYVSLRLIGVLRHLSIKMSSDMLCVAMIAS